MKNRLFAKQKQYSLAALAILTLYSGRVLAQESHAHPPANNGNQPFLSSDRRVL
jgi:hypothetical protein